MAATGPNAVPPPPGLVTGYAFRGGEIQEAAYRAPAVSWSSGWLVSNQPDLVDLSGRANRLPSGSLILPAARIAYRAAR
jgi:hypothetical protein